MRIHKKMLSPIFKREAILTHLALIIMLMLTATTYAQSRSVSGTVKDKNGEPLIGVSIQIKGKTTQGTITDLNGKFSINAQADATLILSYVGYDKQLIPANKAFLDVIMQENSKNLDDVVVVGYGTVKKSDVTGSLSSVSVKEIEKMPATNLSTALQGKIPGVVIQSNDGNPGSALKIRIRGANSISGGNDPLYIIDGIAGDINGVNVNDVASVEVLKDASATAIYGSRGANGVVLITTKRGDANTATQVQFSSNTSLNSLPKKYDLLDAASFAKLTNIQKGTKVFTDDQIANYQQNGGTDWQNEIFQTGITQNYQLSLSGGSASTNYYLSGNYINQSGIVLNTKAKTYNIRSNISTTFLKKFKLDLDITASSSSGLNTDDNGSKGSPVWLAPIMSPTYSPYGTDGGWNPEKYDRLSGPGAGNMNPLMVLNERYSDYHNNGWGLNTKLNYKIFNDMQLDVLFSTGTSNNKKGSISKSLISTTQSGASQSLTQYTGWQNSNILTYHKQFQKIHDLTVTAVNEQTYSDESSFSASASNIDPITVGYDNLGIGATQRASSYRKEYTLQSFLGRASYSLLDRYLLTASYRADASSKFTEKNKWAYFPSAAFAWRITEEPFMKNQEVISNLKLRSSWGLTGNQGIGVYDNIGSYSNLNHSFGQSSSFTGTYYTGITNPDLKWETTEQANIGVDLGFLNGKLNVSVDYYEKNTRDLLLACNVPQYDGGGTILKNVGQVRNNGIDITLYGTPISNKSFSWSFNLNVSKFQNKVMKLADTKEIYTGNPNNGMISSDMFVIKEGESLGAIYGYVWDGIYTSSEATEAAKLGFKPGDNKYEDLDGDNKITSADRKIIGNSTPKLTWGFGNTFTYKNFSLDIMLQGVSGRDILNVMYGAASTSISDAPSITTTDGANYWSTTNENAKFANPLTSTGKNNLVSTQFLQNGSYLKVKNIALSYMLKKNVTKFADFKLTLSAQNLLTLTKYKGYDPEVSTTSGDTDGAVDMGAYPNPRTVTFGIQMNF